MTLKNNLDNMNSLIIKGKAMEAFEKYYDDGVVMQENENPPVIGKEANRKRELEFFDSLETFHKAEIKSLAIGDDTTMVEWALDVTPKGMPQKEMKQVTVQKWKDNKIISEKFYYDTSSKTGGKNE